MPSYYAVQVYTGDRYDNFMEDAYSTQLRGKDPNILTNVKLQQDQEEEPKSEFPVVKLANMSSP